MASASLSVEIPEDLHDEWRKNPRVCIYDTFRADLFGNELHVDDFQVEVMEAVRDYDRVRVQSGRGVGKTATAAMVTHWWLACWKPALVVASAGTWSHLEDKLWPEINAWGKQWDLKSAFDYQTMAIYSKEDRETWKAVASSSDKAVNVEGFHNPNFLLLVDEAKGMPDEIWAALLASLSGQKEMGHQKALVLSTPPTADVGWYAKTLQNERWKTVHISGLDSPRVSQEYIDDIVDTFGEDSAEYSAYVLGEIPEGITGQLIRARWLRECQGLLPEKTRPPVLCVDVARQGGDLCVIGLIKDGVFQLFRLGGPYEDEGWSWYAQSDQPMIRKRIAWAVKKFKPAAVCIDDTGLGGGLTDELRYLQSEGAFPKNCTIWPVNFGAAAKRPDRFNIRKAEMWWQLREFLRNKTIGLPTDEQVRSWKLPKGTDFKRQLLSPIYESDMKERVWVYDKRVTGKEVTKPLPLKSPDVAHALILGVDYYQRQEPTPEPPEPPSSTGEALFRMVQEQVQEATRARLPRTPFQR